MIDWLHIDIGIFYDVTTCVQELRRKVYEVIPDWGIDSPDMKKVSESQKCAQSVLSSNERHSRHTCLKYKTQLSA